MSQNVQFKGGSLRLKGGPARKASKASKAGKAGKADKAAKASPTLDEDAETPQTTPPKPPAAGQAKNKEDGQRWTATELKFREMQQQRAQARIEKAAHMSHKDRVARFNEQLDKAPEHFDLPRIGGGG